MESSAQSPSTTSPKKGGWEVDPTGERRIFTRECQRKFLKYYARYNDVSKAAAKVGFKKATIYKQARKKPEFGEQMDAVRTQVIDELQDKMIKFAKGTEAPVHGAQLTAMFGVLKAYLPERWRENAKVSVGAEGVLATLLSGMVGCLPDPNKIPDTKAIEHGEAMTKP